MTVDREVGASVGHVGIEVKHLPHSQRFYRTLLGGLGFRVILDTDAAIGFSNHQFSVWLSEMRDPRIERKAPTGDEVIVADHLAILVHDKQAVDTTEAVMKTHGFTPLFPCEEHPQFEPGYYAVSFCDPDNYVIEIYTREPSKPT